MIDNEKAHEQRNSYEIGDYVSTCTGHGGIVQSYALMSNGDRYYQVRILDGGSMKIESQVGTWMQHLAKPEEILGEDYFS